MTVADGAAPITGKRKRPPVPSLDPGTRETLHITVGSYERVLYGFTASIILKSSGLHSSSTTARKRAQKSLAEQKRSEEEEEEEEEEEAYKNASSSVTFQDTFLLAPHTASIRAIALSPSLHGRRYLATGGADERINIFQLQRSHVPSISTTSVATRGIDDAPYIPPPSLTGKELGTLTHHASTITTLTFASHSKLISTGLDNTLTVTRTRDWATLSTLRAPHPNSTNRPEGDTSAPGDAPKGISSCGIHPSHKLAVTVGLGERCMRLWDLVKGKRAGVLAFDRRVLQYLEEGRGVRSGEGRQVEWSTSGDDFVVAFEKGVVIYDASCRVRGLLKLANHRDKVGIVRWLEETLVVATEQGRVLLYGPTGTEGDLDDTMDMVREHDKAAMPVWKVIGTLPTPVSNGRIKDIAIAKVAAIQWLASGESDQRYYVVTASSSGNVGIYSLASSDAAISLFQDGHQNKGEPPQVGILIGTKEIGYRITCLTAFEVVKGRGETQRGDDDGCELAMDSGGSDDMSGSEEEEEQEEAVVVEEAECETGNGEDQNESPGMNSFSEGLDTAGGKRHRVEDDWNGLSDD